MYLDQFRCLHTPNSLKASFLLSRIIRDPPWENVTHEYTNNEAQDQIARPRSSAPIVENTQYLF